MRHLDMIIGLTDIDGDVDIFLSISVGIGDWGLGAGGCISQLGRVLFHSGNFPERTIASSENSNSSIRLEPVVAWQDHGILSGEL